MSSRFLAGAGLAVLLAAAPAAQQAQAKLVRLTRQDADRFQSKLVRIVTFGSTTQARSAKAVGQTIELTDAELNSYLRYHAQDQIPVGIVDPMLNAVGDGRVAGRAIVDLDAVRKQKQRGWLDPMGYLSGRLPITATGTLVTKDGVGQFRLESAEVSGVAIPKAVLQELLTYYSATPENPNGINMDDPFELPSRIREIKVGREIATIVQ